MPFMNSPPAWSTEKQVVPSIGIEVDPHPVSQHYYNDSGLHPVQPGLIPLEHVGHDSPHNWTDHQDSTTPSKPDPRQSRDRRICGVSRRLFWILLTISALILLVVALGIGLGVSLTHSATRSAASSTSSTSSTSIPTTSSSSTMSTTSTASPSTTSNSAQSSSSAGVTTSCPGTNNTLVTYSGLQYRILCDRDVHSSTKVDLSSSLQTTFEVCISTCASMNFFQNREDVSAVYNFAGTGTQTPGTCWCLGNTSTSDGAVSVVNVGNDLALVQ